MSPLMPSPSCLSGSSCIHNLTWGTQQSDAHSPRSVNPPQNWSLLEILISKEELLLLVLMPPLPMLFRASVWVSPVGHLWPHFTAWGWWSHQPVATPLHFGNPLGGLKENSYLMRKLFPKKDKQFQTDQCPGPWSRSSWLPGGQGWQNIY